MAYSFFPMLSRMKYINRWALMRNIRSENLSEHSLEVSIIAHALAVIHNRRFGGNINTDRAALLGLYHDVPEILTGDMPTPVKYYDEDVKAAYDKVENTACNRLLELLPEDLKEDFSPLLFKSDEDEYLWKLVKAADKISALIKCIEEQKAGNNDFSTAKESTLKIIENLNLPEAESFINDFIDGYSLTLDQLN